MLDIRKAKKKSEPLTVFLLNSNPSLKLAINRVSALGYLKPGFFLESLM